MIRNSMAKFLISEEQKRQMHDITVITVLRSTIKALDKAISWWTEVDQKKKERNYAIENRHARRSKERKVLEWSKQAVSGYALTWNIPEYPVGKSSFSSQVLPENRLDLQSTLVSGFAFTVSALWFSEAVKEPNSKQRRCK